ncbi:MAG: hypothetical protein K5639_00590, partial [Eubacterium sp.]|nr:hypothetical protein [Eubacterium sp.]
MRRAYLKGFNKMRSAGIAVFLVIALAFSCVAGTPKFAYADETTTPVFSQAVQEKARKMYDDIVECFSIKINAYDANDPDNEEKNFHVKFNKVVEDYVYYRNAELDKNNKKVDLTKIYEKVGGIAKLIGNLIRKIYPERIDTYKENEDQQVLRCVRSSTWPGANTYLNEIGYMIKLMEFANQVSEAILDANAIPFDDNHHDEFCSAIERLKGNNNSRGLLYEYEEFYDNLSSWEHLKDCLIDSKNVENNDNLKWYLVDNVAGMTSKLYDRSIGRLPEKYASRYNNGVVTSYYETDGKEYTLTLQPEYIMEVDSARTELMTKVYKPLLQKYKIETLFRKCSGEISEEYLNLNRMDEHARETIAKFISDFDALDGPIVYGSYYNYETIKKYIDDYEAVVKFIDMIALIKHKPETQEEITYARKVYDYFYKQLSDSQQKIVPKINKENLDKYCGIDVFADNVRKHIESAYVNLFLNLKNKTTANYIYEEFS